MRVSNNKNGALPVADVVASAREASLRYVTDGMPGITRLRRKQQKFEYLDPRGRGFGIALLLTASGALRFPRPGKRFGFAPAKTAISRPRGAMLGAVNSFGTTKIGEKFVMRPSMTA